MLCKAAECTRLVDLVFTEQNEHIYVGSAGLRFCEVMSYIKHKRWRRIVKNLHVDQGLTVVPTKTRP